MIRSLYSGVSGMKSHQTKLDVIANNVANVNTTAYKTATVTFEDTISQTIKNASASSDESTGSNPSQVGIGSRVAGISSTFTQGTPQYTGRPLDMAIQGNGFFVVEDINGKRYLTRDGSFKFDNEGYLVNQQGFRVLDEDGDTIQIDDPITTINVSKQGQLTALDEAGEVIDQVNIGIAFITNPESLYKEGGNLYTMSESTMPDDIDDAIDMAGTEGRGTIEANSLEMSNVDLSDEFANMIVTQRGYQANVRVISVSDQMLEELINLKR
ncbi:MAG: flagellar basal-body rod protein FlgF [Dehalobacterium sp.]